MSPRVRIAVIGDYDPAFPPHRAVIDGIGHAAESSGIDVAGIWTPTDSLAAEAISPILSEADALWIAPGSPYHSMNGALRAIRWARETGAPLLGTCGGFQHVVLEYARSVLGMESAAHAEYEPSTTSLFVVPLSCSLVGQRMSVRLAPGSRAAALYGRTESVEQYYCNFGLNPDYEGALERGGLRISGRDEAGEARIVELPEHPFFIATLFVPPLTSSPGAPHPLVEALVRVAKGRSVARTG
jgi:CTP synthase (UTP-ammonia lyase)